MLIKALLINELQYMEMRTSKGIVILELFTDKASITTENFINYVNSGFYNGLVIHCATDNWIIQTSGYGVEFNARQTASPVKNEADKGLKNIKGKVAMVRYAIPDCCGFSVLLI